MEPDSRIAWTARALPAVALATVSACATAPRAEPAPPPPVPPIATIIVGPANAVIAPRDTLRFFAQSAADLGTPRRLEWTASDTTIAAVDSTGLVTGRRAGLVGIRATFSGPKGSVAGVVELEVK